MVKVLSSNADSFTSACHRILEEERWQSASGLLLDADHQPNDSIRKSFHEFWNERGEYLRAHVNNDNEVADLLWMLLPTYEDGSMTLYRGENKERWESKELGFCWTATKGMANMFASGLYAAASGGCPLEANAQAESIICAPGSMPIQVDDAEYIVTERPTMLSGHDLT